jgi:hypothetical protein
MSRPFYGCIRVAMATWMTLTAGTCGKGLFTGQPLVVGVDSGAGVDASTGADASAADLPGSDAPISPVFDAYPDERALPDVAADVVGTVSSKTEIFYLREGSVSLGIATLDVLRLAFAWPTYVTLTLVSEDGKLEDHRGAIGPIFSLSKTATTDAGLATLQIPATLTLVFTPNASIPPERVTLAYFSTQSDPNLWIPISDPSPNPHPGTIVGTVNEFSEPRWFAPVESCTTGQPCPAPWTCLGAACQ